MKIGKKKVFGHSKYLIVLYRPRVSGRKGAEPDFFYRGKAVTIYFHIGTGAKRTPGWRDSDWARLAGGEAANVSGTPKPK